MRNALLFITSLILLTSCIATQNVPAEVRSRVFRADKNAVYNATLTYLVQTGYQIEVSEKESGVITTGYSKSGFSEPGDRTRLTALIQPVAQERTSVILTLTVEVSDSTGIWSNDYFSESKARKLYEKHLHAIARQLQI